MIRPDQSGLREALRDAGIHEIVDTYAPKRSLANDGTLTPNPAAERYLGYDAQLGRDRFIVPVYGVQGAGKSTLLTALAFREPVLPVDVNETTCVPVEIVYAEPPSPDARILFQDGRAESAPATDEGIARFVHNDENPGNKLGVDRVIVESSAPVLKGGLVLVDLPGGGSLTRRNAGRLQAHVGEAVGVLFLLRTIPPLTGTEMAIVSMVWSKVPSATFVLNRWHGETQQEVREAHDEVRARLKQAATKYLGYGKDFEPDLRVVHAKDAHDAVMRDDAEARASSELPALEQQLTALATEWPERVGRKIRAELRVDADQAEGALRRELAALDASADQLRAQLAEAKRTFEASRESAEREINEAIRTVRAFAAQERRLVEDWKTSCAEGLRNTMRTKMRAGILDGPRLDRALTQEQDAAEEKAYCEFYERLADQDAEIAARYKALERWDVTRSEARYGAERPAGTAFVELLPPAGRAGGGAAGGALGAAIGSTLGPIGTVLGGAIGGILGWICGGEAGSAVGVAIQDGKREDAEPHVFRAIERFVAPVAESLLDAANSFEQQANGALRGWLDEQTRRYQDERNSIEADLSLSGTQKEARRGLLTEQREALRAWRARWEEGGS